MNKDIILSSDFLDKLSDDEIYLLINIFPKERLLEPIKKNSKKFRNETKGYRIDIKSKMFIDKLPNIYFDRIRKHDGDIIKIINKDINFAINTVNNHIFEVTSDKDFLEKSISSNNIIDFAKLVHLILEELKPEYVKLYFKLIGQKLSEKQNNYIDTQMKIIIIKNQLVEEISKELEIKYREQIINIENAHKTETFNQLEKIKEVKEELNNIKLELSDEKKHSNLLCNEIEKIKNEKNDEANISQDFIRKLNLKISKMEKELSRAKSIIKENDLIKERLNNDLNIKYDEYSINAQERWNLENEALLKIQNNNKKECGELEKIKIELIKDIRKFENEKLELEDKILELKSTINNFIDNIDERLIEKALYDSLLKFNSKNSLLVEDAEYKHTNLYIKNNKKKANIRQCNDIHDFAENLAINLENLGVKDIADEVANYVVGVLASNMTPLICGYKAREIATAISISYSGETPYIITLPNGYTNSKELLELYNLAESNVVLIEDAIGTMNEDALMPLLREKSQNGFSTKLLLISTENMDSVKYMPVNLLNHIALVMINNYGMSKNADNEISDARKVFEEFVTLTQFDNEYKLIKKLTNNLKFGSPYEMIRSVIVAYSNKLSNSKLSIQGYLRSELMYICKCNNKLADLENNIQKYQLGDNLAGIVRGEFDE